MKQTVMTSVYGVTFIGARDQIMRRLEERAAVSDETELFAASCYAAKVSRALLFMQKEKMAEFVCILKYLAFVTDVMFSSLLPDQVTLTALEEMFQNARSIKSWLGDCAKVC